MKLELHAHTAQGSKCGRVDAVDLVAAHVSAGYAGVVITDHYNQETMDALPGTPVEQARAWMHGYETARQTGERLGLRVFFGLEARLPDCDNDYLILGAQPDFVLENPLLYQMDLAGLHALCHQWGALLVQAHPNRKGCHPADPAHLDGVEVFNGNPRHANNNASTLALAQAHLHLIRTSGSDFHQMEDLGRGGILTREPVRTPAELAACLRGGEFERLGEIV